MIEFSQIGWFDSNTKRFCYDDEKRHLAPSRNGYTQPVFVIDPDTASRLSVNIEAQNTAHNTAMFQLLCQLDKYLEAYKGCSICADSTFHRKIKETIAQQKHS